jgi:hypothetical protein
MNDKHKHTEGNWQAERSQDAGGYFEWFVRRDGDSTAIASDITDPETGQPSEANAVLFAAAPELLAALEAMVKRIEYYSAIPESERPTIEQWEYTEGSTEMDKARAAIAKAKP